MEMFSTWFGGEMSWTLVMQIVLDAGLIILLFLILGRRSKPVDGSQDLVDALEKIVEETRVLAREFESNLQERKALIQNILSRLDERLSEAERVCSRLEEVQRAALEAKREITLVPASRSNDQEKVLQLAGKGLDAESIANRLQKPIGEVELILNLKKLYKGE
ncbi:hypothetical protein [Desulforhabdus sp. TSK]|uniref:DUF6115 domain-containing protein n=1 Tax=Desulforhabdus sp. TSK TaxID=2925014 RepID=UPI001FC83CD2|nr:hypothetical protein [Desulforhabdus sp. TSK]GKT07364.1 hypothetical protein DSTSK_06690 [Desulforhabdus sp. TSK]